MITNDRAELAADIRAWLEWQKECGAEVWKVDNWNVWKQLDRVRSHEQSPRRSVAQQPKKTVSRPQPQPKNIPPPPKTLKKSAPEVPEPSNPAAQYSLTPWWEAIINRKNKEPRLDISKLPPGETGVHRAFAFRDTHCSSKVCKWGQGGVKAPVILIEGHKEHLNEAALKMLGDMRSRVLQLSKEKIYWLPLKREIGCGLCDKMALAQLNTIQPKAVLIMGRQGIDLLDIADRHNAFKGEEVRVELSYSSVPAICMAHPMDLLVQPNKKKAALKALQNFRFLLQKLRI